MSHPDENTLRLFAAGRLDSREEDRIESHLTACPACMERLHRLEHSNPAPLVREMKAARFDDSAASQTAAINVKLSGNDDFEPGDLIGGNYRLEKQLGRGGMGIAWKAYDLNAERFVVLKFVPKEIQHVPEAMRSVRESFQKVHALQHQHICPLYGLFNDPKYGPYLVMKFIDGPSLDIYRSEYIENHGPIPFDEIVRIISVIADSLDYAHARKVVHRDIKPQNVMIGTTDGVQVIDFGLADEIRASLSRSTNHDVTKITGTRSYMAPEQWEGKRQDARTDQYALAVTAYELFSGHVPFSGNDTEVLRKCVLHTPASPIPGLPDHVNAALLKGLSKKRGDRFENCADFVEALSSASFAIKGKPLFPKTVAIIIFLTAILVLSAFFSMRSSPKPNNEIVVEKNTITETVKPTGLAEAELAIPPQDDTDWHTDQWDENINTVASVYKNHAKLILQQDGFDIDFAESLMATAETFYRNSIKPKDDSYAAKLDVVVLYARTVEGMWSKRAGELIGSRKLHAKEYHDFAATVSADVMLMQYVVEWIHQEEKIGHVAIAPHQQRLYDEYVEVAKEVAKKQVAEWNKHNDLTDYLTGEFHYLVLATAIDTEDSTDFAEFTRRVSSLVADKVRKSKEETMEEYEEKLYDSYVKIADVVANGPDTGK